jgi:hypothetical protein
MQLNYLREITGLFSYPRVGTEETWAIAEYKGRYAFIWNLLADEVTGQNRSCGNAGEKWFDSLHQSEMAFLDRLEQNAYYYPTEDLELVLLSQLRA